ncbi:MAG TPA: hypothetical protein VKQ52_05295, partial [Puia sp.]|nr:hypothetical protein [Puia sp.]
RIGFDRHTVTNQYMLRRMNSYCRESEQEYRLTPTPKIRWYRSKEERQEASQDQRVIRLGKVIGEALESVCQYDDFKKRLEEEGYRLYKTVRGIAFKDADNVVLRGYETGYPWKEIEATLRKNELRQKQLLEQQEVLRQQELAQKQDGMPRQESAEKQGAQQDQESAQREEERLRQDRQLRHRHRHHF